MTLAYRIIPTLLVRGRELVKGVSFDSWRSVGLAMQSARIHSFRGVDELMILDISATREGRGPDLELIEELTHSSFIPLSVGGGIRSVDDAYDLLRAGADKVVVCTGFNEVPNLIQNLSTTFGKQAIVVSIDVKQGRFHTRCGTHDTRIDALMAAECAQSCGAGEILLSSVELDGTMNGYDLFTLRKMASVLEIPVVASGGCGKYEHMHQAIEAGASAVAAGAMFQFTDATPRNAAYYLDQENIEVRL